MWSVGIDSPVRSRSLTRGGPRGPDGSSCQRANASGSPVSNMEQTNIDLIEVVKPHSPNQAADADPAPGHQSKPRHGRTPRGEDVSTRSSLSGRRAIQPSVAARRFE